MRALASLYTGVLVATLMLLGACDRSPYWVLQPDPVKDAEMLYLPDRAGIIVQPVKGIDGGLSDALTKFLVAALQDANVPAGSGPGAGNRHSQKLTSDVQTTYESDNTINIDIGWRLIDATGLPIGEGREVRRIPAGAWRNAEPEIMSVLAADIAPQVADLIQEETGEELESDKRQPVYFAGLADAPGDGNEVLPPLVSYLLDKNGYAVADAEDGVFSVSGSFASEPAPENMERIAISWRVTDPAGSELGVISQENMIPRGALDGNWGDAAFFIAEGAVQGVHALLVAKAETEQ